MSFQSRCCCDGTQVSREFIQENTTTVTKGTLKAQDLLGIFKSLSPDDLRDLLGLLSSALWRSILKLLLLLYCSGTNKVISLLCCYYFHSYFD